MTEENSAEPKQKSDQPQIWPARPAVFGVIYGFMDPNHATDVPMVAMTLPTWQQVAQQLAAMKAQLEALLQENSVMKQDRQLDGPRIILPRR